MCFFICYFIDILRVMNHFYWLHFVTSIRILIILPVLQHSVWHHWRASVCYSIRSSVFRQILLSKLQINYNADFWKTRPFCSWCKCVSFDRHQNYIKPDKTPINAYSRLMNFEKNWYNIKKQQQQTKNVHKSLLFSTRFHLLLKRIQQIKQLVNNVMNTSLYFWNFWNG